MIPAEIERKYQERLAQHARLNEERLRVEGEIRLLQLLYAELQAGHPMPGVLPAVNGAGGERIAVGVEPPGPTTEGSER